METIQILLGAIIAILVSLPVLAYLLFKQAKSISAGNEKISGKIDELIAVKNVGDQKQLELFGKMLEEYKSGNSYLVDIINNTSGRLREQIHAETEHLIEIKNAGDQKQLELLRRNFEENTSNNRLLVDIINNTSSRLREQIHAEIEHLIDVKSSGDQKLMEIFTKLLDENLSMHKTLQEVIDLEKELSSK